MLGCEGGRPSEVTPTLQGCTGQKLQTRTRAASTGTSFCGDSGQRSAQTAVRSDPTRRRRNAGQGSDDLPAREPTQEPTQRRSDPGKPAVTAVLSSEETADEDVLGNQGH